jgi:hypothetical protein
MSSTINTTDLHQLKSYENDIIVAVTGLLALFQGHAVRVQDCLLDHSEEEESGVVIANRSAFVAVYRRTMCTRIKELHLLEVRAKVFAFLKGLSSHCCDFDELIKNVSTLPELPQGVNIRFDPEIDFPSRSECKEFIENEDWYPEGTGFADFITIFRSIRPVYRTIM